MGFEFSVSRPEKLVRMVGRGALDFETCSDAMRELIAELAGEAGFGILVDIREADYAASAVEVRRFASMVTEPGSLRGHRIAIVVSSTVMFGLGRMFSTYMGLLGGEADVFRAIEPATRWLDQPGVS